MALSESLDSLQDDMVVVSEMSKSSSSTMASLLSLPRSDHPVQFVMLIDFHHKRGPVVEYSFPALPDSTEASPVLPSSWKHLAFLALPDGLHNHNADRTFFTLPALLPSEETWFGVSCCRQIESTELSSKKEDVTRNTVMKAIVVISTLPVFHTLEQAVSPTTKVLFEQRDFGEKELLTSLYKSLNR